MALTNFPYDPLLDLAPWVGQRQCTYRFVRMNSVTGQFMGEVHPIRSSPTISHDTTRTIKRQLNLSLGAEDTRDINVIQDRIIPYMVFPNGAEYQLGVFVFTQQSNQIFTSGELSNVVLNDEMYIIDQQITKGFDASNLSLTATAGVPNVVIGTGIANRGASLSRVLNILLEDFNVRVEIESSEFVVNQSWSAGTMRGSIIEAAALVTDYFSPWFDNQGIFQFIRAFNPALAIPDFDWDAGNQVMRSSILQQSDVLNAPNRFVVISNAPGEPGAAVFGIADVPVNAPNSFENRGFYIPSVVDMQVLNIPQCQAIARNLAERQTIVETTTLTTAPDPRHDSYNVIKWRGEQWLELSWQMTLSEGQPMSHTLRRSYH
jgi:hypothetical protein